MAIVVSNNLRGLDMRDNYQGGSLGGYIVVAVLLALALIGGLYGLQRYNASRENQDNTEVARDESANENREEERRDTPSKESEDKDDTSNDTTADKDDTSEESSTGSSTDDNEELPQTGPAETAASAVALGALAFAGTSFVRSRNWTSRRD